MKGKVALLIGGAAVLLLAAVAVVVFVVLPMLNSSSGALAGKWKAKDATTLGENSYLEFSADKMTLVFAQDLAETGKMTMTLTMKYKVNSVENNTYNVTLSDVDGKIDFDNQELKEQYTPFMDSLIESMKEEFVKDGKETTGKIVMSADKKEISLQDKDGKNGQTFVKM